MATTTSRLALYKSADDGSEVVDVATNLNQNFDKIDAAMGFVPATSSVPPSPTFAGMGRHNSDDGKGYYRNSTNTDWVQILNASSTFEADIKMQLGKKVGIGRTGTLVALLDAQNADTSVPPAQFRINNEAQPRVSVSWTGISFGPGGSTSPDISLDRVGAGELNVSNDFSISGDLNVAGSTTVDDLTIGGNLAGNLNVVGDLTVGGVGSTVRKVKTSATIRANTTTVSNDPDMFIPLVANAVYLVRFYGVVGAVQAADIKTAWSVPSGAAGLRWCLGPDASATSRDSVAMRTAIHVFGTEVPYGMNSNTLYTGIFEQAVITMSGTPGNVNIQWAQVTSNATGSVLVEGSLLEAIRIS